MTEVSDDPFAPPVDDEGRPLPRLPRVPEDARLREYTQIAAFSPNAKPLAKSEPDAEALLAKLLDQGLYLDAIKLIARATHPWRAIEWALEDVRTHGDVGPGDIDDERLAEVEQWLDKPSEDARREMMDRSREDGHDTPGSMVMGAVGWSYGSLAPKHLGVTVPPPEGLASKSAANALIVVATKRPKLIGVIAPKMIRRGLEFAQMDDPEPWPPEDETPEVKEEDVRPELPSLSKSAGQAVVTGPRVVEPTRPAPPPIKPEGPKRDEGGWAPNPL